MKASISSLFLVMQLLRNNGIDAGDGGDVHDVTHRAFDVGEVDGFVQFPFESGRLLPFSLMLWNKLVSSVGRVQVREYQCIDFFAFQAGERVFFVTQFVVEGKSCLHFSPSIARSGEFLLHVG